MVIPKINVFDLYRKGKSKVFKAIIKEVNRLHTRTALLEYCDFENGNLMLLVLEESKIDLVRYDQDFYQLLHLKSVINSDALSIREDIPTKTSLTEQDKEHIRYKIRDRAHSRIYSLSH